MFFLFSSCEFPVKTMKRVLLRDKNGDLVCPPPLYHPFNGSQIELSQIPLYAYIPVETKTEMRLTQANKLEEFIEATEI